MHTPLIDHTRWYDKPLLRRWLAWLVPGVVVVGVLGGWLLQSPPRVITIATAKGGGQYHRFAGRWADHLLMRSGAKSIVLRETHGSVDNLGLLRAGEADLAIIQNGVGSLNGLVVIAPLYPDVVQVVARKGSGIRSVGDLRGHAVVLGEMGSGMRASALALLSLYGIEEEDLRETVGYFDRLTEPESGLDAAVVTTGFVNPDLRAVLQKHDFELLEIPEAAALKQYQQHLSSTIIPKGIYSLEEPPVPREDVVTVATTALLVAREDVRETLVEAAVLSLYEDLMLAEQDDEDAAPLVVMGTQAVRQWSGLPLHRVTKNYLFPLQGFGEVTQVFEGLVAMKELLFALGAGVYFLWLWTRQRREQLERESVRIQRDRLEELLNQTVRIEEKQIAETDPQRLKAYMDEVTYVKLQALKQLTHEELRGDRMFSIFLMQCSNLTRKIQEKVSRYAPEASEAGGGGDGSRG